MPFFRFYLGFTPILRIRKNSWEAMRLAHVDYTSLLDYELDQAFCSEDAGLF